MESHEEMPRQTVSISTRWGLAALVLALVLCGTTAISLFYLARERKQAHDLATANQDLSASLAQVQSQLQALSEKFNALSAAGQTSPAKPASVSSRPSALSARTHARVAPHRSVARRQPPDDPRFNQLQQQLSGQQKQLASTREEVEKARTELDGKVNSTRDELNGSIARTHEELVALEKRGERNYYEFRLDKSNNFQRVGPLSVSLRKVNYKHKSFNLALMVDDFKLDKKNVNLFEPVWITLADRPQPLELVVNRVSKDEVQGYLSEPKYKKSELSASTAPATPASADKTQSAVTPR